MSDRGERRARTERIVRRRCLAAKRKGMKINPGMLKKRSPVCYCSMCRRARKPGPKPTPKDELNAVKPGSGQGVK